MEPKDMLCWTLIVEKLLFPEMLVFMKKVFPYANHIDPVLQTNNTYQISYFNPFFESINYNAGNVQTEHNHPHTESQIENVTDSLRRSTQNRRLSLPT